MKFVHTVLLLCCSLFIYAQKNDDNIVITSANENYVFSYSKSKKSIEVKQELNHVFSCRNYRDKAPYYEFFDEQTVLEGVDLLSNGKKAFATKTLKDYSVDDIFYSDARIYELELDFPKAGWNNEVKMKKTVLDPRYFCTIYFSEGFHVEEKQVTVVVPRWMKAEIKEFNFKGYKIRKQKLYSEKEDADVYQYNIRALPARKQENNQPGPSYFLPHLLVLSKSATIDGRQFTFFNTLNEQYKWYRSLVNSLNTDEELIKQKAKEITAGSQSDMDRIKAVLYWVHNNIRYIAFEDGIAGFKPDEAQNVLNKKYGDCKGMANLTKALLKSLGFDARLAWIGTNHIAYDYSTPALCVDNHMICCLIYNGKKFFLDGTETFLAFDKYAERIQGRPVLIEDGESYLLEKVPLTSAEQNLTHFSEKVRIKENVLEGDIEYLFRGESKERLLHNIHATRKETVSSQLETYISNNNKNYLISQVNTSDIEQIDGDLTIKFKLRYEGAVSSFGNETYIDMDFNKIFNQSKIDSTRNTDFLFSYKYNYLTDVALEIPAGYKISYLPAGMEVKHPDFVMMISFKSDKDRILYKKQIQILNTVLKKEVFHDWNKAIDQLSQQYLDQVILIKK